MYFLVVLCYTMLNCLCILLFMFGGSLDGAVGVLEHIGLSLVAPACQCANMCGGEFACFLLLGWSALLASLLGMNKYYLS